MDMRDFLNKMRGLFKVPAADHKPMTPDEKELEVYLERERKKKIKKLVHQYRKEETKEFIQGNPENSLLSRGASIVDTPSRSGELDAKQKKSLKKHKGLLNQKSVFMK